MICFDDTIVDEMINIRNLLSRNGYTTECNNKHMNESNYPSEVNVPNITIRK